MNTNNFDPNLISKLRELKNVSTRNPQAAARGRAQFLAEASQLRETASNRKSQRHNGWSLIFRKETPAMKTLISALTTLLLVFASATTVFAAQNDLPTEPLYGIKTLSEDASLWLTNDPASKLDRLMELAQVRTYEMAVLIEQGETIPEQVAQRLNLHIETALQLAAGQGDEEMQGSLLQIQSQLQTQEQVMTQLQTNASENGQPALEQARVRTQEQLQLANQGLEDPLAFRNRYQYRNQNATGTPVPTLTDVPSETSTPPAPGYGPGPNQGTPAPGPISTPSAGYGPGPNQGTPAPGPISTPGASYGPGPTTTPSGSGTGGGGNNEGGGSGGGKP